jgi:hypothetical protein
MKSKRGWQSQKKLTKPLVDTAGKIRSGRSAFTAIGLLTFETGPRATIGGCNKTKHENKLTTNLVNIH